MKKFIMICRELKGIHELNSDSVYFYLWLHRNKNNENKYVDMKDFAVLGWQQHIDTMLYNTQDSIYHTRENIRRMNKTLSELLKKDVVLPYVPNKLNFKS